MPELNNTILKNSANLKGYWRAETGALTTDSSTNGKTLTNNNTVADGTGNFGGCFDFGPSNTNKSMSTTDALGIDGGAMSISLWVKVQTEPGTGVAYILAMQSNATTDTGYKLTYQESGGVKYLNFNRVKYGVANQNFLSTQTLGTSVWHHIVYTYDTSAIRGYLDGVLIGTGSASGNGTSGGASGFSIGSAKAEGTDSSWSSAFIDDVAVYDVALTADQVKELYEGRYIGELQPQAGLVAFYHMSSELDYSGSFYHLTNNNTVTFTQAKLNNGMNLGTSNTNKYLSIANDMGITSGACSVTLWVKITAEPSSASFAIFERGDSGVHVRHWVRYIDTAGTKTLQFNRQRENAANDQFAPTITALGTSIYHHIAYAYDGTTLVGYLDGVAIGSVASSGNGISGVASDYLYLGHSLHATTLYCDAIIDEVGVWNKNLTAVEVRKMYAVGKGRYL